MKAEVLNTLAFLALFFPKFLFQIYTLMLDTLSLSCLEINAVITNLGCMSKEKNLDFFFFKIYIYSLRTE